MVSFFVLVFLFFTIFFIFFSQVRVWDTETAECIKELEVSQIDILPATCVTLYETKVVDSGAEFLKTTRPSAYHSYPSFALKVFFFLFLYSSIEKVGIKVSLNKTKLRTVSTRTTPLPHSLPLSREPTTRPPKKFIGVKACEWDWVRIGEGEPLKKHYSLSSCACPCHVSNEHGTLIKIKITK